MRLIFVIATAIVALSVGIFAGIQIRKNKENKLRISKDPKTASLSNAA